MLKKTGTVLTVCAFLATPALAGNGGGGNGIRAEVDGLGGDVVMRGKTIDGVFGGAGPDFSSEALSLIHADVQADGITTDGRVSFLLSLTDAGISWIALVDDENQSGEYGATDSVLGMSSTAPTSASPFVNDEATDITFREDLGNGMQLVAGLFSWDSTTEGDGFAWGNLADGDFISFLWTDEGPAGFEEADVYQFLSYTQNGWEIVATADYTGNDQFGFSFNVVPAPAALGVLGFAALLRRRSRR